MATGTAYFHSAESANLAIVQYNASPVRVHTLFASSCARAESIHLSRKKARMKAPTTTRTVARARNRARDESDAIGFALRMVNKAVVGVGREAKK